LSDVCSLYFALSVVFVKTAEGTESKINFPSRTIKYIFSYLIFDHFCPDFFEDRVCKVCKCVDFFHVCFVRFCACAAVLAWLEAKSEQNPPLSVIGWNTVYFGFEGWLFLFVFMCRFQSLGSLQRRVFLWGGQLADP